MSGIKWYKSVIGMFMDNNGALRNFFRGKQSDSSMSKDQRYLRTRNFRGVPQIFEGNVSAEARYSIYLYS